MNASKSYFNNQHCLDLIDAYISEVEAHKNQSISEVHQFLLY